MQTLALLTLLLAPAAALSFDAEAAKARPVTKVINLLKDMQKQLEKEGEGDEEVYDKMVCWCETNDKLKTQEIADAEQLITDLGSSIEELTAKSSRLTAEIANLDSEVAKNTKSLDTATALRTKELAEFNGDERDKLVSVNGLKNGIQALSKQNTFLQTDKGADALTQAALTVQSTLLRYGKEIPPHQKKILSAFVQAPEEYLQTTEKKQPASAGSYAPQSGAIFGILKNMKESFENDLVVAQKEEAQAVGEFNALKASKEDVIAGGNEQIMAKTAELAASDEKRATDKTSLEDTTKTLAANRDFLAMLKTTCADIDAQMQERQKTRSLEIVATSKALAILSGDEAHEVFTRTFNPALVQKSAVAKSSRREKAAKIVARIAKKMRDPKLSLLASSIKLDSFGAVVEDVEKMIGDLEKEKDDEVKFKDWCIDEVANNGHETALNDKDKAFLDSKVADLKDTMKTLDTEIQELNAQIAEMQLQMKDAATDREAANKDFQVVVADQRATQQLLQSALDVLKGFYSAAALAQTGAKKSQKEPAGPAPPPGFKTYEKSSSSGGVMGMIGGIITDAKALEDEATRGEASAQKAYEDFVADTNASIAACNESITNKSEAKGKAEGDKAESDVALDSTLATLQQLSNELADVNSQCTFTLKNFDVRQSSREEEIANLKESIQVLHGAQV